MSRAQVQMKGLCPQCLVRVERLRILGDDSATIFESAERWFTVNEAPAALFIRGITPHTAERSSIDTMRPHRDGKNGPYILRHHCPGRPTRRGT